jgi:hypothetical protein
LPAQLVAQHMDIGDMAAHEFIAQRRPCRVSGRKPPTARAKLRELLVIAPQTMRPSHQRW